MFDVFRSEIRRFRSWALGYLLAHSAALLFLSRMLDLAQLSTEPYYAIAAVYALSGLLLGLYQMGGYRRPNAWLSLIHRPLEPARIALALVGAAACLLAVAILLPLSIVAAWQAGASPQILDQRHLGLVFAGFQLGLLGYLSGAAAMLAPRRAAAVCLVFLALLPAMRASGLGALLMQWLTSAWLLSLVLIFFKPDLSRLPKGAAMAVLALPAYALMWLVLQAVGSVGELLWIAQGSHPNNLARMVPGSAKQADMAEGDELLVMGLAGSTAKDAPLWREMALISDIQTLGVTMRVSPVHGTLTNGLSSDFSDAVRDVRWKYSHDLRRYVGFSPAQPARVGVLGVGKAGVFDAPPVPGPAGLLLSRDKLYRFDEDSGDISLRFTLPAGEIAAGLDLQGDRLALLSSQALYLFDARPLLQDSQPLSTRQRVALPNAVGNLQRVDVLELLEGSLVSFTFTRHRHNGQGPALQSLWRIGSNGVSEPVAQRNLITGYGPLYSWQGWWTSPLVAEALAAARRLFAVEQPEYLRAPPPKPLPVIVLALALSIGSLLAGLWHVRRTALGGMERLGWCLGCLLTGLPGWMALRWLVPVRETLPARSGTTAVRD